MLQLVVSVKNPEQCRSGRDILSHRHQDLQLAKIYLFWSAGLKMAKFTLTHLPQMVSSTFTLQTGPFQIIEVSG